MYTGYYTLILTASDTTNYYPIPPISVFIDAQASTTGSITTSTISDTAQGGFQQFTLTLSDYAAEALVYTFYPVSSTTQDAAATVVANPNVSPTSTSVTFAAFTNLANATFQSPNATAAGLQKFVFNTSASNTYSNCWGNNYNVQFSLNSSQQVLTGVSLASSISGYLNAASSGSTLLKNQIQFTFTPPMAPMILNCMLACSTMAFNDSQIINGPTGSIPFTPNPLYQWYTGYYPTITTIGTIVFSNLVRGMQYQLRCIASSTQVTTSARTTTAQTWATYTNNVAIMTPVNITPACASFIFTGTALTTAYMNEALNYCQQYFSASNSAGVFNPACIVCSDSRGMYPTGVAFTAIANTTCPVNVTAWKSSKLRFLSSKRSVQNDNVAVRRVLQNTTNGTNTTNSTNNTTPAVVTYTYNLCPVQNPVCAYDTIGAAGTVYATQLSNFIGTLNTASGWQTLTGAKNLPITSTLTLSDLVVPTINFTATAPIWQWSNLNPAYWNLTIYNPTQVFCWWMQGATNTSLTITQIQACNSSLVNCGNVSITSSGAMISNTQAVAPSWSTDENIWFQCVNNIPQSSKFANITSGYWWNTGPQPGTANTTTNTTTNTTSNTTTNKTNNSAGSYIAYGIALLISFVFIL